jgi:MATE family multidrug resistance protein
VTTDPKLSMRLEIVRVVRLATPFAALQLANAVIQAVATVSAGHLGTAALAGVAIAHLLYFSVVVVGMGIVLGYDPLIAQAIGEGDHARAQRYYRQSILTSLAATIPVVLGIEVLVSLLPYSGVSAGVSDATASFIHPKLLGVFSFLAGTAARSYLQALGIDRPLYIGAVLGNVVNVIACSLFAFGDRALAHVGLPGIGLPAFGLPAAGAGAAASMIVMHVAMASAVPALGNAPTAPLRIDLAMQQKAFRVGLPVGLHYLAEVGAFTIAAVALARRSDLDAAAHQIALTPCSIVFQIQIALAAAGSIRVGHVIGEGSDASAPRRAGLATLLAGGTLALVASACFVAFPGAIVTLITDDAAVIPLSTSLVALAGFFLLADGTQGIGAGILRGTGHTGGTFVANLVGHYGVGLPLGLFLMQRWGVRGMWMGLCAGLVVVATLLVGRFLGVTKGAVPRLVERDT